MTRKEFLKLCALLGVSSLFANSKNESKYIMPTLFLSHGSPMNIIANNDYTKSLKNITNSIKKPKAILVISAHWISDATYISISQKQETIYDFFGFPEELYDIKYEPAGSIENAKKVKELLNKDSFFVERGLDHGAWSVLHHMYPNQDIPTFQLSINKNLSYEEYFNIGKILNSLRQEGILIISSGGATHNLRKVKYPPNNLNIDNWAKDFDNFVKESFEKKDFTKLINAKSHKNFRISHPFDDHFIPLLFSAGMVNSYDKIENFHEEIVLGNLSMRCIKIG